MKKRWLSLLLAAVFLLSCVPISFAEESNQTSDINEILNGSIILKTDSPIAYLNGQRVNIDENDPSVMPQIVNDRTLVPLRFIGEGCHSDVSWDGRTGTIGLELGLTKIQMKIGDPIMLVNDSPVTLETPPQIVSDRTLVPLRAFVEALGREVTWDDKGLIIVHPAIPTVYPNASAVNKLVRLFTTEMREDVQFYVAPDGNDENDGTIEKPFATIERAKEAVAEQLARRENRNVYVNLRGGEYYLEDTLVFTEQDSPRDQSTVTYQSYEGEQAYIYGGQHVTNWEKYNDTIYQANVGSGWKFGLLTENGQRATLARYPNEGYLKAIQYSEGANKRQFSYSEEDNVPEVKNKNDARVFIWPGDGETNWFSNTAEIKSWNTSRRSVELKTDTRSNIGTGSRFFFEGALEFLDSPGEFYLDKSRGILYYYPMNEDIENQVIVAPKGTDVIQFVGKSEAKPVQNIVFNNLDISTSNETGDVIHMENARAITIQNSKIHNSGQHGVHFYRFAQSNRIINCEISELGHSGVQLDGSDVGSGNNQDVQPEYLNRYNEVVNCHIFDGGKLVGNGAGIQFSDSGENYVAHNNIHDFPRYGISFKAIRPNILVNEIKEVNGVAITQENYLNFMHTKSNIVAYNDLHHLNTDSQDTGLIESWGAQPNNIITNNHLHDSSVPFSFEFGIYLDDGSFDYIITKNVVDHLQEGNDNGKLEAPICVKGVRNRLDNNLVVNNPKANVSVDTNQMAGEPTNDNELTRNIYYNSGDVLYNARVWKEDLITKSEFNTIYNDNGSYKMLGVPDITEFSGWQNILNGKFDQFSNMQDPKLINPQERDYDLQYDSPAYKGGFEDINYGKIGLKENYPFATQEAVNKLYLAQDQPQISGANISIEQGESLKLNIFGRTETAGYVTEVSPSFTSSDNAIASISSDGTVTGKSKGIAKITASANGLTKELYVLVGDSMQEGVMDVTKPSMIPGDTASMNAYAVTELGQILKKGVSTTFTSENPSVVKVDASGTLQAVAQGEAVIRCTYSYLGQTIEGTKTIKVLDKVLKEVKSSLDSVCFIKGDTRKVSVSATMTDDSTASLNNAEITYYSADDAIASVSADGTVTANAAGRTSIVTVITMDGIQKQSLIEITVLDQPYDAYAVRQATNVDSWFGVAVNEDNVGSTDSGDYACYGGMDFGSKGPKEIIIELGVPKEYAGGKVFVRLDSKDGPVIGEVVTSATADWSDYGIHKGAITATGITGVHDVYLTFAQTGTGNLKSLQFVSK